MSQDLITYNDLVTRYGNPQAFDLLLAVEKLARDSDSYAEGSRPAVRAGGVAEVTRPALFHAVVDCSRFARQVHFPTCRSVSQISLAQVTGRSYPLGMACAA